MDAETKKAFNAACKLLAVRDRSVHEMRAGLARKGFPGEAVEGAVLALSERRLLDDAKFAALYAQSLYRNKKAGPRYISAALQRKGVEKEKAEEAVAALFPDNGAEEPAVEEWIERKNRAGKVPLEKRRKRIYDFLLRKGFSRGIVLKHLKDIR